MTWRIEGRVNVVQHGKTAPSTLEWSRYVKDMTPFKHGDVRTIVFSRGGGPDGTQRLQLSSMHGGRTRAIPVALVTDSVLVRAIVGALRWFNPMICAFELSRLHDAFEHLGLSMAERQRVMAIRTELERELDDPLGSSAVADGNAVP